MFIVGTAGHVDHGKSSLIHALTGKHPDRLKEEQTRGMTIDLGYAWTEIAETVISFVDVPGHNDFLNNMLVGISEVQGTLLVVDANAGIMPQTIEHAHILSLLGIQQGVIALTKVDLIDDAAWLEWIEHDIRNLLQQAGLPPFPIIHSSVVTG
ncbi:MAG UNVERIFIED_CONTAM: GTP-binding protein [Anaerolineae bacterium]|jgi:selenocysteine-specific elongation factor